MPTGRASRTRPAILCLRCSNSSVEEGVKEEEDHQTSLQEKEVDRARKKRELQEYVEKLRLEMGDILLDSSEDGVECTGEPSVDPSKSLNPNQGDSEWMDDW